MSIVPSDPPPAPTGSLMLRCVDLLEEHGLVLEIESDPGIALNCGLMLPRFIPLSLARDLTKLPLQWVVRRCSFQGSAGEEVPGFGHWAAHRGTEVAPALLRHGLRPFGDVAVFQPVHRDGVQSGGQR